MYKIIEISNAPMWNGKTLNNEQWNALVTVLRVSKFSHTIKWVNLEGEEILTFI